MNLNKVHLIQKFVLCLLVFFPTFSVYALSGKEVYEHTCAICHGSNGKGTVPGAANFTDKNGPLSKSDTILIEHITKGYQTPGSPMAMPPKGGNPNLTDEDLKNALAYIREQFSPKK